MVEIVFTMDDLRLLILAVQEQIQKREPGNWEELLEKLIDICFIEEECDVW